MELGMRIDKKEEFDRSPFLFAQWQSFASIVSWMDTWVLTVDDVFDYIQERREEFRKDEEWLTAKKEMREYRNPPKLPPIDRFVPKYCDECKAPMLLYEVNTNNANQTGDNSRSVHQCTKCGEQVFYEESRETLKRRRYLR